MSWRYLVGLILALAAIAAATEEAGVSIRDAWVREAPPGATMMAGYMVLKNNTPRSQVLVAARSSGFGTVMIHRMLLNPKRALHAGDRVDINLEFLGGLVIPVAYEVRK